MSDEKGENPEKKTLAQKVMGKIRGSSVSIAGLGLYLSIGWAIQFYGFPLLVKGHNKIRSLRSDDKRWECIYTKGPNDLVVATKSFTLGGGEQPKEEMAKKPEGAKAETTENKDSSAIKRIVKEEGTYNIFPDLRFPWSLEAIAHNIEELVGCSETAYKFQKNNNEFNFGSLEEHRTLSTLDNVPVNLFTFGASANVVDENKYAILRENPEKDLKEKLKSAIPAFLQQFKGKDVVNNKGLEDKIKAHLQEKFGDEYGVTFTNAFYFAAPPPKVQKTDEETYRIEKLAKARAAAALTEKDAIQNEIDKSNSLRVGEARTDGLVLDEISKSKYNGKTYSELTEPQQDKVNKFFYETLGKRTLNPKAKLIIQKGK